MHRDQYEKDVAAFMESNNFQFLMRDKSVQDALEEGEQVPTVGRPNTKNKIARIRGMEPFVSTGILLFRDDWRDAPEGYKLLIDQMSNFPQGAMDGPDALQGAHEQSKGRFYS